MPLTISRRMMLALTAAGLRGAEPAARPLCVFSKHLQFLDVAAMTAAVKALGGQGVDLTVRPKGHIEPERVADELPRAVEVIRAAGLSAPMITTGIVDAKSPHAELVLRTARKLGIDRYRWGGLKYDLSKSIPAQLAEMRPRVRDLAALNQAVGMTAIYHTHSGAGQVGASMWDLWRLLDDQDPRLVAVNFDVAHAVIEGGLGGWQHSLALLAPMIRGVAVKDFRWGQDAQGRWRVQWCPLGQGMVPLREMLTRLKATGAAWPVQLHFEYPLFGADHGATKLDGGTQEQVLSAMRRDVALLLPLLS